jgi:hypothetical protein
MAYLAKHTRSLEMMRALTLKLWLKNFWMGQIHEHLGAMTGGVMWILAIAIQIQTCPLTLRALSLTVMLLAAVQIHMV